MGAIQTRDKLLKQAGVGAKIIAPTEDFDSGTLAIIVDRFHMVVNHLQIRSLKLWDRTESHTAISTASSTVSNSSSFYRCIKGHVSAATSEPGVGATWEIFWIEEGTTGSAWSVSSVTYTSNNEVTLPATALELLNVYTQHGRNTYDTDIISYDDFTKLTGDRYATGIPRQCYVETSNTITSGLPGLTLRLYPHPEDTDFVVHYMYLQNTVESEVNATALDLPKIWYYTLVKIMEAEIAHIYGLPRDEVTSMRREAKAILAETITAENKRTGKQPRLTGHY